MEHSDQIQEWEARTREVVPGMGKAEVTALLGEHSRVTAAGEGEMWIWDKGQLDGTAYSIQVVFENDLATGASLETEPGGEQACEEVVGPGTNLTAGILALVCGLGLGYMGVYRPIAAAMNGEPLVTTSMKAALVAPASVVLGLALIILGRNFHKVMGQRERLSRIGWIVIGGSLAAGAFLYWLVDRIVAGYGYA
jgi:hypothetical protein